VRAESPHPVLGQVVKDHGYLVDNLYSKRLSDLRRGVNRGVNDDGPRTWKTAYDCTALLVFEFDAETA